MIDLEFFKTLTILYIEDDPDVSENFLEILRDLFKDVVFVEDGLSALEVFRDYREGKVKIDIIISDMKLPKLNGLDLLESIRKEDDRIPFIFTTGYSESENLLKAIDLDVTAFLIKPIDIQKIIFYIQRICEKRYQDMRILHYQDELKQYVEIVNQVALVYKVDQNQCFSFVNDFFCEVSGYQKEEIVSQELLLLKPKDVSISLYDSMWEKLNSGNIWKGKFKHKKKDDEPFFTTSTIFPLVYSTDLYQPTSKKNQIEYMCIEFLTTEYENKQRKFKKEVMYNLQETRRINLVARQKIDDLQSKVDRYEQELKRYKHFDMLEDTLKEERKKNIDLTNKVKFYEAQLNIKKM